MILLVWQPWFWYPALVSPTAAKNTKCYYTQVTVTTLNTVHTCRGVVTAIKTVHTTVPEHNLRLHIQILPVTVKPSVKHCDCVTLVLHGDNKWCSTVTTEHIPTSTGLPNYLCTFIDSTDES